ncbi:MAG: hypothetical protein AAF236_02660 [Verrucomicrobiota bacterium]
MTALRVTVEAMYQPQVASATVLETHELDQIRIDILGDIESASAIQYLWIAAAFRPDEDQPSFFVASECNALAQSIGGGSHFLGVFSGEGHANLGASDRWAELEHFVPKALELVGEWAKTETPGEDDIRI